jgi:hypothetical protein
MKNSLIWIVAWLAASIATFVTASIAQQVAKTTQLGVCCSRRSGDRADATGNATTSQCHLNRRRSFDIGFSRAVLCRFGRRLLLCAGKRLITRLMG